MSHPSSPPARPAWFYHAMALATIMIWSFSFLFIVKLNRELTSIGVVVLRMEIFGLFVLALFVWRRPRLRGLSVRDWALVLGLSLVGGPLYHQTFSWSAGTSAAGVSRIDPALLGLVLATVPVHTGWLAWLFLGERLSLRRVAALTLGLVGVAVVIVGRFGRFDLLPAEQLEGPIGATAAAMLGGGVAVLTRAARRVYGPLELAAVCGVFMVAMNAALHPIAGLDAIGTLSAGGWIAAIFLGIFGLGVAFLTWATALSGLPAVTVAMYLFLASVLAAFWGWIFDDTPAGWPFVAGAALVLSGLIVMATSERRSVRTPAAPLVPAPAPAPPPS
ncbi:MAG: DMT family transporter [Phycisphaerales bacterium]|nr:DMT family transporter [Phycisphaerales bacterium]